MCRSIYDILTEIFIIRTLSTKIYNTIVPFLHSKSPEEAREILDNMINKNISKDTHKAIFRKVPTYSLIAALGNFEQLLKELPGCYVA